jgi:hypothetical protein
VQVAEDQLFALGIFCLCMDGQKVFAVWGDLWPSQEFSEEGRQALGVAAC